jgi:cytochrome c peroxidase
MRNMLGLLMGFAVLSAVAAEAPDAARLRDSARRLLGSIAAPGVEALADPRVALGQALFWDPRLSSTSTIACASCHTVDNWGSDARPRSVNARGGLTLQSQTVFNAQAANGLRWLADRPSGQLQAIGSITGSMGFEKAEDIIPVLLGAGYQPLFQSAFADAAAAITVDHYGLALQAYQMTLLTPAPFDDWLAGDDEALNDSQLNGLKRFLDLGCAACHNGPLLGGTSVQRFGIHGDYWHLTGSTEIHRGVQAVSGLEADAFRFRVAPLRNVARTGPYFHDGSVADLTQAIAIMAQLQLAVTLDDEAVQAIASFLESLTGELPAHYQQPPLPR